MKGKLSARKARTMLHRHEFTSAKQQRFLGARASGEPMRKNHHLEGAKVLSNRVLSLAYIHIDDGAAYEHEFKAGATLYLLTDGTIEIRRHDGKKLWGDF